VARKTKHGKKWPTSGSWCRLHKLIVSVHELKHKDRREALKKRRLWHVQEAAGRYAIIHGDAGAARFFRLPSHIVRYWHQKMSDPTFHLLDDNE